MKIWLSLAISQLKVKKAQFPLNFWADGKVLLKGILFFRHENTHLIIRKESTRGGWAVSSSAHRVFFDWNIELYTYRIIDLLNYWITKLLNYWVFQLLNSLIWIIERLNHCIIEILNYWIIE